MDQQVPKDYKDLLVHKDSLTQGLQGPTGPTLHPQIKFRNRDLYMTFNPTATEETNNRDEMKEKWVR